MVTWWSWRLTEESPAPHSGLPARLHRCVTSPVRLLVAGAPLANSAQLRTCPRLRYSLELCDQPGLGQLAWKAAVARDLPVLVILTAMVAVLTQFSRLVADAVSPARRTA